MSESHEGGTPRTSIELNIPATAEERERQRLGGWDKWYASLPADLRRRLSIHDFKRLGDCFRQAFNISDQEPERMSDTPKVVA